MNGEERTPASFSWMRRWGAVLNLIITVAAVLVIVAAVNYLVIRHYQRFHWSQDVEAQLSQRTRTILRSLTNDIKVVAYYNSKDPLFPRVKGLLKEYEIASSRIQVQFVDYLRDLGTAQQVKQQYQLNSLADKNLVIFESNGRRKAVYDTELSDYDTSGLIRGETNEVERTHFKGELLFTSKIFAVATERSPIAYFLTAHGEHRPDNVADGDGYGKFAALLANENNFELRGLQLGGTNEVPSSCNLLIIAGPRQPLDRTELDAIQHYLEQGGRMLVAFHNETVAKHRPTGLERLLARWGVDVGENVVIDSKHSFNNGLDAVPVELGQHPVVNPLAKSRVQLVMPRSIRSLRPAGRSDETRVDELLFTSPASLLTDLRSRDPTPKGPQPLMVVVEKGVPGMQRGSTRIIVLGDSVVWSNHGIEALANKEFAASAANWLVNQATLLGDIPRRAIRNYRLTMTRGQLRSTQGVLLLGMPAAVLLVGFMVWARRRN
ncbi:MAG TPA: DUF4350 domain-containing protein [Methylomirabilota bacterium]|nr:DUF4350 domain-containing protein [Methylomirabilota bacterium]